MSPERITTSSALYFEPVPGQSIPLPWLDRARRLFVERKLSPILFTAGGGNFRLDDCCVLADHGDDLTIFGERVRARGDELVGALGDGVIKDLGIDSPCPGAADREDWRAAASVFLSRGECYVGVDRRLASNASVLLRRGHAMANGLFDVRYGIAYMLPHSQDPAGHASGIARSSFTEVREMIRHRREWNLRKRTADDLWFDELNGKRRHLTGLFRGAYPASILSEAHLRRINLPSLGLGTLSPLGAALWLWQLADSEIPVAEDVLAKAGALVGGVGQ